VRFELAWKRYEAWRHARRALDMAPSSRTCWQRWPPVRPSSQRCRVSHATPGHREVSVERQATSDHMRRIRPTFALLHARTNLCCFWEARRIIRVHHEDDTVRLRGSREAPRLSSKRGTERVRPRTRRCEAVCIVARCDAMRRTSERESCHSSGCCRCAVGSVAPRSDHAGIFTPELPGRLVSTEVPCLDGETLHLERLLLGPLRWHKLLQVSCLESMLECGLARVVESE
jgi:hypothetical protein